MVPVGADGFDGWVEQLADPIRSQRAYWHLTLSGQAALPAIRCGLSHNDRSVRRHCTQALDHLVDEDSFPELISMLVDGDDGVRWAALHALACDRCKDNVGRPAKEDVLEPAIRILRADRDSHVRAMAAEVVGRWVHTDPAAVRALSESRDSDPEPSVRKKAGWYAPGGPIFAKRCPDHRATFWGKGRWVPNDPGSCAGCL